MEGFWYGSLVGAVVGWLGHYSLFLIKESRQEKRDQEERKREEHSRFEKKSAPLKTKLTLIDIEQNYPKLEDDDWIPVMHLIKDEEDGAAFLWHCLSYNRLHLLKGLDNSAQFAKVQDPGASYGELNRIAEQIQEILDKQK